MYYNLADTRRALAPSTRVEAQASGRAYLIDKFIGCGGSSLLYLAHQEGSHRCVALKELFPRHVENSIVERRDDGRVVIWNPLGRGRKADSPEIWNELEKALQREVSLTRKARAVCDPSGTRSGGNPDVLDATDFFQDTRGNRYLALDTAQGESMRDWIQEGFLRDGKNRVVGNGRLKEILRVLEDVATILDRLHGDSRMLHLDLSPDNIWLARNVGGTRMTPHIIDYGSAFDLEDKEEQRTHHFTCNPWAAPEILALADLNDLNAGYVADESSDTYALVSILFWALTGECFTPALRYNQGWRDRIREEYGVAGLALDQASLAEGLIALLDKGLSADQQLRYRTAADLKTALESLRKGCPTTGALLPLMDPDELMSFVLLERYPLYNYRGETGDMDVLCLGCGRFVQRMILSMISVGQMIRSRLNIHVISSDPVDETRRMLLARAPGLEDYSNLMGPAGREEYVHFTFAREANLLNPETCARVAKEYAFCRSVVISLGRNRRNVDLARMYGKELSALNLPEERKTVIHYFMCEDAAGNTRSDVSEEGIARNVELAPFGNDVAACAGGMRSLGRLALRLNYLYCKLSDPRTALEDTVSAFLKDPYSQRSSCASAAHLRCKLESLGIPTDGSLDREEIVERYEKALATRRGELLELEHRRWMMDMIAEGYRLPTLDEMESYAFRTVNGVFIPGFKNKPAKLHHCLVPCDTRGVSLPEGREAWDSYDSEEAIENAPYDELDRMSLQAHLIVRRRVEDPDTGEEFRADLHNKVGHPLNRWADRATRAAKKKDPAAEAAIKIRVQELRGLYDEVEAALENVIRTHLYANEKALVNRLERAFEKEGITDADFARIRNHLSVYEEYTACRDYKAPDDTIAANLLWLLYAGEPLTVIKMAGRSGKSNVAGPLLLEPVRIVFFGMERQEGLENFLRGQGLRARIRFQPCDLNDPEKCYEDLERLREGIAGQVVLDITDTDDALTAAAMRLARVAPDTAVVRSDETTSRLENIHGFCLAQAYPQGERVSAEELQAFLAAPDSDPGNQDYDRRLDLAADRIWTLYQRYQENWNDILVSLAATRESSLEMNLFLPAGGQIDWASFDTILNALVWDALKDDLQTMERGGVIRSLETRPLDDTSLTVTFLYPETDPNRQALETFFHRKQTAFPQTPWNCLLREENGGTLATVSSGVGSMMNSPALKIMVPVLRTMEDLGLVRDLTVSPADGEPASLRFAWTSLAVMDCLTKGRNVLELYAWHCARRTGWFDDCRSNASMGKEDAMNGSTLILTRGAGSLAVSCRTDPVRREHLYEMRCLTDRVSSGGRAVILCAQPDDRAGNAWTPEDLQMRERAQDMGVCLVNVGNMGPSELGQVLKEIASGPRNP